jgi:YgiT-type zinc finger domain-containing protein
MPTRKLHLVKTCLNCGASMRPGQGALKFERDGLEIEITNVPKSICDSCGEEYVPGPVALKISDLVDDMARDLVERAESTTVARSLEMEATPELRELVAV